MKRNDQYIQFIIITVISVLFTVSCSHGPPPGGPPHGQMPLPTVSVLQLTEKLVTETDEYVGKVYARDTVDIVARVRGYLKRHYFTEGSIVNKGKLLFLIEPDEYQAEVDQAKADIENIKAELLKEEKDLNRTEELIKQDFISHSAHDQALAARDETLADLKAKKALLKKAELNLSYTKIYAPITGKISDLMITEGNFVGPDSGALANIVKLNPIYVTYNIPADDFARLRLKLAKEGKNISNHKVDLILSNDTIYPHKGIQNFFDNKVDDTTGTIKMRAEFPNTDGVLLPGQLVKVLVYSDKAEVKKVILQSVIQEDTAGKYVYVVGKDNKVTIKRVKVGRQIGKDWVVESGISKDDKVISTGLQKVMPGMKVNISSEKPEETEKKDK